MSMSCAAREYDRSISKGHMTIRMMFTLCQVVVSFFCGEASWGLTEGLRRLRWLRLIVCIIPFLCSTLIVKAFVDNYKSYRQSSDDYSYYEGKVLEEKVAQLKTSVADHNDAIKRLLEQSNTTVLLAVRQQDQIDKMQEMLADEKKVMLEVLVAIVILGGGSLLKDVLQLKFRRERIKLRSEDDKDKRM